MARNIFDDSVFFNGYMELRRSGVNYNELLEQPAMRAMLPKLHGKAVLDLGCGYGDNCRVFIKRGASRAVGVDISERMLRRRPLGIIRRALGLFIWICRAYPS